MVFGTVVGLEDGDVDGLLEGLDDGDVVGDELVCPKHHYRFGISDGQLRFASEEPCRNLRCYELVYRDNEIGVMLDG